MARRRGHARAGLRGRVRRARRCSQLGLESARRYAAFCAELEDPGYRTSGTLVVARDRDEAEALDRLAAFRRELGLPVERLRPSQARALEPALAPTIRLALDIEGDHAIDPRMLVAALRRAFTGAAAAGPRDGPAASSGDRVTGVTLERRRRSPPTRSSSPPGVDVARLEHARARPRPGPPGQGPGPAPARSRTAPASSSARSAASSVYFVPRGDGRYVLGATMEERGWDTTPTAGGVYELLRDLSELVPGVFELEIEELIAGLRPATPDNLPAIGRGALDGLVWATGHYRNGILLDAGHRRPRRRRAGRRAAARVRRRGRPAPLRRSARMKVLLNGESAELVDGATVKTALESLDLPGAGRGVAVAVDAEVVPRGQWDATQLHEGARVEILRAIQGG